jgi:hypothetical protein
MMTDEEPLADTAEDSGEPPTLAARLGLAVLLLAIAVVAIWGLMWTSATPIRPDQAASRRHFQSACGACHRISADAEPVRVER